jgi:hypothetical protein
VTDWYAPNQQAVGTEPAVDAPAPAPGRATTAGSKGADVYDPGEHTVAEVEAYVAKNPDQADAVYKAEAKGKNRTTLLEALKAE